MHPCSWKVRGRSHRASRCLGSTRIGATRPPRPCPRYWGRVPFWPGDMQPALWSLFVGWIVSCARWPSCVIGDTRLTCPWLERPLQVVSHAVAARPVPTPDETHWESVGSAVDYEHMRIGHEPPSSLSALQPLVPLFGFNTCGDILDHHRVTGPIDTNLMGLGPLPVSIII